MTDKALKEDTEFNKSIINFFIKNTRKLEESLINKIFMLIDEFVGRLAPVGFKEEEQPE